MTMKEVMTEIFGVPLDMPLVKSSSVSVIPRNPDSRRSSGFKLEQTTERMSDRISRFKSNIGNNFTTWTRRDATESPTKE